MDCVIKWFLKIFISINFFSFIWCETILLHNNWDIQNSNGSILIKNETIPSGIFTALENNKITGSILNSYNDVNLKWVGLDSWTYSLNFNVDHKVLNRRHIVLTFKGVDTISTIYLNNVKLGETANMFVRYSYDVRGILKDENHLRVSFKSPILEAQRIANSMNATVPPECPVDRYNGFCHMNMLRKMQASFAWDWGLAAPSIGIWKSVQLEYYDAIFIRDINYQIIDGNENFIVKLKIFIETGFDSVHVLGDLIVELPDIDKIFETKIQDKSVNGMIEYDMELKINKFDVNLWWPNGHGFQTLYYLHVMFQNENEYHQQIRYMRAQKIIRIGFRTVELIQQPLQNGFSFFFRVNGKDIFMKGTNWIPSRILPEKSNDHRYVQHLMKSAKYIHINMMRVWGGGLYEHDHFYDLADTYGILIWQDMMFACAMYPATKPFLNSVREEIQQNVRRLQWHPSIAVWAGNNENEAALVQNWYGTASDPDRFSDEYRMLYVSVIKEVVESIDKSREFLTSSPSNGKRNILDNFISRNPQDDHYGDIHYYNYDLDGWNPNIYRKPRFCSEYGFQSYPAIQSWKATIGKYDNLRDLMYHRQHFPFGDNPIVVLIKRHLILPPPSHPNYTEIFIYFSQLSQAMVVKTETEVYRGSRSSIMNTMGALYWQLNDVWVAPSWSSIDHFGQFKILHNWAREFLAPIYVFGHINPINQLCLNIIRDDDDKSQTEFNIKILVYKFNEIIEQRHLELTATVLPNSALQLPPIALSALLDGVITRQNGFLELRLWNEANKTVAWNFVLLDYLKDAIGIEDPKLKLKIVSETCTLNVSHVVIESQVIAPALFVYLQLNVPPTVKHIFSRNGYIQTIPREIIGLEYSNQNCSKKLTIDDLNVLHVNEFLI